MVPPKILPETGPLLAFIVRNPQLPNSEWMLALWLMNTSRSWVVGKELYKLKR